MKYAIIGDLHGTELNDLERALIYENPDVLICTGDFDQTKTIHQFIDLEKKYRRSGKTVIKVPGNHDHAVLNGLNINSGTIKNQGKTGSELHQELMNDSIAYEYINELVMSRDPIYTKNRVGHLLDKYKYNREYPTIIMHGAYDGDFSGYPSCPAGIQDLWMRLITEDDFRNNFDAMDEKGYKVMIRGHDHKASYVFSGFDEGIVAHKPEANKLAYRLFNDRLHTINPGALFDGLFATIDTSSPDEVVPILKYHKL